MSDWKSGFSIFMTSFTFSSLEMAGLRLWGLGREVKFVNIRISYNINSLLVFWLDIGSTVSMRVKFDSNFAVMTLFVPGQSSPKRLGGGML